jgi:hypothetical protein
MKPKLVNDWQLVLKRSLSVWLAVASALFGLLQQNHTEVLEILTALKPLVSEDTFGQISLLFAVLVPLGRILAQKPFQGDSP